MHTWLLLATIAVLVLVLSLQAQEKIEPSKIGLPPDLVPPDAKAVAAAGRAN